MSVERRLGLLLAAILVAAVTLATAGEAPSPSLDHGAASPPRQRIYPLQFDAGAYEVRSFATMRDGQPAIFAVKRGRPEMLFDQFLSGRQVHVSAVDNAAYLRIGAVVDSASTLNRIGLYGMPPQQQITSGDLSITFIPNSQRSYLPPGLFDVGCLDPAASYMQIRHGNVISDKVALYVFAKPVRPVVLNWCDRDLFAPPHDSIRIIDPILIAKAEKSSGLLIAGGSYVSMPVVVSVPSGNQLRGDGASLFVVDKSVVDNCYLSAVADFENKVNAGNIPEHERAELAALIEKYLLEAIKNMESK